MNLEDPIGIIELDNININALFLKLTIIMIQKYYLLLQLSQKVFTMMLW